MNNKIIVQRAGSGMSGATLLGIVFVTLKLTGYIDWSWWWVTCPFWIGAAICLGVLTVTLMFLIFAFLITVFFE